MNRRFFLLLANITLFCTGCVVPPFGATGMMCIRPPVCPSRVAPLRPPAMPYARAPIAPRNGALVQQNPGVTQQRTAFRQEKFAYAPRFRGHAAQWPDNSAYAMAPHDERTRNKEKSPRREYGWDKVRRGFRLFGTTEKRCGCGEHAGCGERAGCGNDSCFDCARGSCCAPQYALSSCGCRQCTGCSDGGCGEPAYQSLGLPHHQPSSSGCNCQSTTGMTQQRYFQSHAAVDVTQGRQVADFVENKTVEQMVPSPVPPPDPMPPQVPTLSGQNSRPRAEEPPVQPADEVKEIQIQPIALWIPQAAEPKVKSIPVEPFVETVVIPGQRVSTKRIQ